jgi:hypothetical protein
VVAGDSVAAGAGVSGTADGRGVGAPWASATGLNTRKETAMMMAAIPRAVLPRAVSIIILLMNAMISMVFNQECA